MIKFTLLVFLFTIISTSYPQEVSNNLADLLTPSGNSGNPDPNSPIWPLQGLRRKGKPCHRRRNNNGNEPWIPSYSSKITHPLYEPAALLQPQALKNEDLKDNTAALNRLPENQQTLLNPETQQDSYQWLTPGKELAASDDEDCAEQLDATDGQAEERALKIIEDCLKNKQKSNIEETLLYPSRRSFFGSPTPSAGSSEESGELFQGLAQSGTDLREGNKDTEYRRKATTNEGPLDITTKSADTAKDANSPALRSSIPSPRICYACSSASNPSCWEPNNRTTIKYCTREYSCVTKTYGLKDSLTLIRDCANSCKDNSIPGLEPKYKSCKLCHHDYCNSATSIAGYNFIIILVIGIFKCTF